MFSIFSQTYAEERIKATGLSDIDYLHCQDVTIKSQVINEKSVQCYIDHSIDLENFKSPVFQIDGKTWMSCTPLEIASHAVPIRKAEGLVGVGGLGLGYFVLEIMQKDEVNQIDVYESKSSVIEAFKLIARDKKGFDKINFFQGDLFKNLIYVAPYDFFYNDIYCTLGSEKAVRDMEKLLSQSCIKRFHYWGLEYDMYFAMRNGSLSAALELANDSILQWFFREWFYFNEHYFQRGIFCESEFDDFCNKKILGQRKGVGIKL